MAIKIYSDKTQKFYNSVEEANHAEFELKEKALAERKTAAEKVETARKAYIEAQKAYRTELENFCKQYGTYHYSTNNADEIPSLFDWLNNLFNF